MMRSHDSVITSRDSVITSRESVITSRDSVITSRDSVITSRDSMLPHLSSCREMSSQLDLSKVSLSNSLEQLVLSDMLGVLSTAGSAAVNFT